MKHIENNFKNSFTFIFEGREINCNTNDTVASALLASGEIIFRYTPKSGSSRGPYCMMGVCFDCLLEIDGIPNRQACLIKATAGMRVKRQTSLADLGPTDSSMGLK